jgi:hypothetical protein
LILGVLLRGKFLGEVSILSGALMSLRGGEDTLSMVETSETDGKVIGLDRGVLGVFGRRIMLVTRLAVRRMDWRTFHCRFFATKKRTALATVSCQILENKTWLEGNIHPKTTTTATTTTIAMIDPILRFTDPLPLPDAPAAFSPAASVAALPPAAGVVW